MQYPCLHIQPPVCYALFIYLLNLFLAFLQPKFDPGLYDDLASQDIEEGEPGLPTSASASSNFPSGAGKAGFGGGGAGQSTGGGGGGGGGLMSGVFGGGGLSGNNNNTGSEEEFRPFIRRLPEFKVSRLKHRHPIGPLADDSYRIYSSGSRQHKPLSSPSSVHSPTQQTFPSTGLSSSCTFCSCLD